MPVLRVNFMFLGVPLQLVDDHCMLSSARAWPLLLRMLGSDTVASRATQNSPK